MFNNSIKINPGEITKIIEDNNLHIYKNIWHYSFNDIFQQTHFNLENGKNGTKILYSRAYNQFSPLLIYTNTSSELNIKKKNAIQNEYDQANENYRHIFWQLRIVPFNNFLERRSKNSAKPKKHFPTLESYEKYMGKINGEVLLHEFDRKLFIEHYDKLRQPEFLSGDEILELFKKNNPDINYEWFRVAYLQHDNEIVAIAVLVDDGKSLNLENIAAKRDTLSFGIVLCTELVKYCCEKNYISFDAGVSGIYGNYKGKIFLDSKEIFKEPESITRYLQFWDNSYWKKIKEKLISLKNNE